MKNYKEVKDLYILGDTSEVVSNLDDSLVTINTVLSSRYVGGIRGMVDDWRGKLVTLQVPLTTPTTALPFSNIIFPLSLN